MFRRKGLLAFTCLVLVAGTAAGIAIATREDNDTPITGEALVKASAAALQYTGGGAVTETEVGDEEGYYEVEVTMADGSEVDVHLDQNFNVIGSHSDREDETDDAKD
jgi:uncharacterized membrane protein YkoI